MFYFKKKKNKYYIGSDKIKGMFGPFIGIYSKNKYFGSIEQNKELENKYAGYKYNFGMTKTKLFIINKEGVETILQYNNI